MDTIADEVVSQVRSTVKSRFPSANVQFLPESLVKRSLICCHCDTEKAAQVICDFIKFKREHPKLFITSYNESVRDVIGKVYTAINSKGPNGETIIVTRVRDWDPVSQPTDVMNPSKIFAFYALSLHPEVLKNGFIYLNDVKDMAWRHVKASNPMMTVNFFQGLLNLPVEVKYICGFNINWASDLVSRALTPLAPKSVRQKIVLSTDLDKLTDVIGQLDKESICQPSKIDIESFIKQVDANGDAVMKEWQGIDHMFQ